MVVGYWKRRRDAIGTREVIDNFSNSKLEILDSRGLVDLDPRFCQVEHLTASKLQPMCEKVKYFLDFLSSILSQHLTRRLHVFLALLLISFCLLPNINYGFK